MSYDVPEFEGVAKRKLDDLLDRGWKISGYSIYKNEEHGLVTVGAFVGWWTVADDNIRLLEERIEALKAELQKVKDDARLR